jgi:spermidine synthase
MTRERNAQPPLALILLLFFLSGALALVYQVVWARMMTHVFGSTAVAVGTVLAAFMCGMAIGSWTIGRMADRHRNPLRLYAWLEVGIAGAALLSHLGLDGMPAVYPVLHGIFGGSAMPLAVVRFLAAFGLIVAPTVLMGATLPVLSRFLLTRADSVAARLGLLYSVNTLGAVVGVLLAGFYLIGAWGIHAPVYAAVIGNLAIGVVAWLASGRARPVNAMVGGDGSAEVDSRGAAPEADSGIEGDVPDPWTLRLVLLGLGISGFTSFAYEIYWTRSLIFVLGNSTYALSTMLAAFLSGIAFGSYAVRFIIARFGDRAVIFGWVQVLLGVFSALALPLLFLIEDPQSLHRSVAGLSSQASALVLTSFGVSFFVMLLPATLIGATFPLVGQLAVSQLSRAGASVGRVYAINTAGNVLGALLPGLVLLGWLGIQRGILAMATFNAALGLLVLSIRLFGRPHHPAWRAVLPMVFLGCVVLLMQAPPGFQFPSQGQLDHHRALFYREGPLATTKVFVDPANGEKHMSVDGITIGGTGNTQFKQLLLAHLPRLLIDDTSEELSVGLGSGILAGESALYPQVRDITVVEIEPSVIEGAAWFNEENHGVLEEDRLTVVEDDIGNFLRTTEEKYRVISADEKTADEYASNGFSYSLEYYELLLEHLAAGGLVAQWVPATLPPRQYRMILRTFTEAFSHVQLWYFLPARRQGPFNSILVGSAEPVDIVVADIARRFEENHEALKSLAPYGLTSVESLLPHFIADERTIRPAVADAPINSLDHPRYEFYYPWDYARDKVGKVVENQAFILRLKRKAYVDFVASLSAQVDDMDRLRQTFAAEFLYLKAFRQYLEGLQIAELYRVFDESLEAAPWNDSLRARVYAQYAYFATTRRDPAMREQLRRRAEALYD